MILINSSFENSSFKVSPSNIFDKMFLLSFIKGSFNSVILSIRCFGAFRFAILANHYRQVINYQDDMMRQMQGEWEKIEKLYVSVFRKLELSDSLEGGNTLELMDDFIKSKKEVM